MKVLYEDPNDFNKYNIWFDHNGIHDIWYEKATSLKNYKTMDINNSLKEILDKWFTFFESKYKTYKKRKNIKESDLEFIYDDVVYCINPEEFVDEHSYMVLFDAYQMKIRKELKEKLNVKFTRYMSF